MLNFSIFYFPLAAKVVGIESTYTSTSNGSRREGRRPMLNGKSALTVAKDRGYFFIIIISVLIPCLYPD